MFARLIKICSAVVVACVLTAAQPALAADDGIVRVKSAYPLAVTIERLKSDIAGKGIKFFDHLKRASKVAVEGRSPPSATVSPGEQAAVIAAGSGHASIRSCSLPMIAHEG
jgi:hypothetical protein